MDVVRAADVNRLHGVVTSVIVYENEPLKEVTAKLASNPTIRGIFVVDSQGNFTGVITRVDLMKWVHLKLFGGKGRELSIGEIFRLIYANKAKDLLRRDLFSITVKGNGTLQAALDRMIDYGEDIIPVLDKDGKIIGDLTVNKVLSALQAEKRQLLE
jgi:CBS domain-containing protein